MNDDHLKIIKSLLAEKFGIEESQIQPSSQLSGDLNLGKIEIIDLIELLSSRLKLTLPEDLSIESIISVSDLLNMIEQQSLEI